MVSSTDLFANPIKDVDFEEEKDPVWNFFSWNNEQYFQVLTKGSYF